MAGLLLLAAAAAGAGGPADGAFRAWQACIGGTTRVAAQQGRLPEEMPPLLRRACPDQRSRYIAAAGGEARAVPRLDGTVASYLSRYAAFYATGLWPER